MPWNLKKDKGGWFVITTATGRKHSRKPLSRAMAERQLTALKHSERK